MVLCYSAGASALKTARFVLGHRWLPPDVFFLLPKLVHLIFECKTTVPDDRSID